MHTGVETDRAVLRGVLEPGETLVWVGRPDPNRHFKASDLVWLPIGVGWVVFVLPRLLDYSRDSSAWWVISALMILSVLWIFVIRFPYNAFAKRRTWYGLTDRRAIVVYDGWRGRAVRAVELARVPAMASRVRSDGSGWVLFGTEKSVREAGKKPLAETGAEDTFARTVRTFPVFLDIPDATAVVRAVNRLWRERAAGTDDPTGVTSTAASSSREA